MKRLTLICTIIVCIGLTVCQANAMGLRERSDLAPFGYNYVLAEDGFIYYNVQTEENSFSIFRMTSTGENAEMILPIEADSFAIANGVIYFYDRSTAINGLARMHVNGTGKETIYSMFGRELQIVANYLYCLADDFSLDTRIMRMPISAEATIIKEDNTIIDDLKNISFLPVTRPNALLWNNDWLYYTKYAEGGMQLGRIRVNGTEDEILIEPDALGYDSINLLGFDGDTLFFSTFGEYADGFVGSYSTEEGMQRYDIPQSFAYDDGHFYYNNRSHPAHSFTGIYRCLVDGSEGARVTGASLEGRAELCGDWIFDRIGGGLNAEPVMVPKDGSGPYRTVPGFGKYDYEANKPVDDTPQIDWNHVNYGTGNVELVLRAYEQPAAFRLMAVENGEPGEEVLFALAESYTVVKFYFDAGEYILKTAQGLVWIGDTEAFGASGTYSTSDIYDFKAGRSYEIKTSMTHGDFHRDNASGFTQ